MRQLDSGGKSGDKDKYLNAELDLHLHAPFQLSLRYLYWANQIQADTYVFVIGPTWTSKLYRVRVSRFQVRSGFNIQASMDILQLSLQYHFLSLSALEFIWSSVQQAQDSKRQLEALTQPIVAQLLQMLDRVTSAGRLLNVTTLTPLTDLIRYIELTSCHLTSVHYCPSHKPLSRNSTFIQKETASRSNFEVTFHKEPENFSDITPRISISVTSFQASSLS